MFGFGHLLPHIPKQQFLFGKMPVEGRVSMDGMMKHRSIQYFKNICDRKSRWLFEQEIAALRASETINKPCLLQGMENLFEKFDRDRLPLCYGSSLNWNVFPIHSQINNGHDSICCASRHFHSLLFP